MVPRRAEILLCKDFQNPRSTQKNEVSKCQHVKHETHLSSIFHAVGFRLAVRSLQLSGQRSGSALFSSKVPSMRGPCVLWSRLQVSHMSVTNVPLNLLLVFQIHTLPKYLRNSSYSHCTA